MCFRELVIMTEAFIVWNMTRHRRDDFCEHNVSERASLSSGCDTPSDGWGRCTANYTTRCATNRTPLSDTNHHSPHLVCITNLTLSCLVQQHNASCAVSLFHNIMDSAVNSGRGSHCKVRSPHCAAAPVVPRVPDTPTRSHLTHTHQAFTSKDLFSITPPNIAR